MMLRVIFGMFPYSHTSTEKWLDLTVQVIHKKARKMSDMQHLKEPSKYFF